MAPTISCISSSVWSAVAPASIPSNFEPSVATSLPSTVPETVILPVTSIPAVKSWFPVDVIGPFSATATDADPLVIDVWSIDVVEVFVTLPFASIVNIGIAVLDPTVPADTPEFASVIAPLSLAVASPDAAE